MGEASLVDDPEATSSFFPAPFVDHYLVFIGRCDVVLVWAQRRFHVHLGCRDWLRFSDAMVVPAFPIEQLVVLLAVGVQPA